MYDIDADNNNAIKKFYYFEFKRMITIFCQFSLLQSVYIAARMVAG